VTLFLSCLQLHDILVLLLICMHCIVAYHLGTLDDEKVEYLMWSRPENGVGNQVQKIKMMIDHVMKMKLTN
jgi:hypothetical protein